MPLPPGWASQDTDIDLVILAVASDEEHEGYAIELRCSTPVCVGETNDKSVLVPADVEDDLVLHEIRGSVPQRSEQQASMTSLNQSTRSSFFSWS